MIDLSTETTFPLGELPRHVPARNGRRMHLSTGFRWASRGIRGVRLETIRVGGLLVTSVEALQRWCEQLTAEDGDPAPHTSAQRERAAEAAEVQLDKIGI
jgi:hypothetical protein